jgi:hypothetical protein
LGRSVAGTRFQDSSSLFHWPCGDPEEKAMSGR